MKPIEVGAMDVYVGLAAEIIKQGSFRVDSQRQRQIDAQACREGGDLFLQHGTVTSQSETLKQTQDQC